MPAACRELIVTGNVDRGQLAHCLGANGYRTITTYQPAGRFWAFQGIECGIYLALAAALIAVTFHLVHRRDA